MNVLPWRLLAAWFLLSAAVVAVSATPAIAGPKMIYSGQSIAVKATISGNTTVLADTGALATTGGALQASSLSGTVPQTLSGNTLHATTIGQGDRVRSEASVGNLAVTAGLNNIAADLAMARTTAVSQGSSSSASGLSHVTGVTLNGLPVVVTGAANQTVPLLDGQMVINEQITSGSGGSASITVNAMHITLSGGTNITLGSSSSGVVSGSQNCSSPDDFATGGGWLPPAGSSKRSFGFIGGVKQGSTFAGHLVFINHQTNERLQGQVAAYSGTGTMRHMDGTGQADNETATFQLDVIDNGEPGTTDHFTLSYQTPTRTRAEDGDIGGGNIQIHQVCH